MARTLKIVLAYDGSDFVGWQRQPAGASVQGCLEDALAAIEGARVPVVGAGRTDAGVHALAQVASCRLSHPLPPATLQRALNARLPDAIRVLGVEDVPESFHARYSARSKTYRYLVLNAPWAGPFERRYVWHVPQPLDHSAMRAAARVLEGPHDFAALQGAGSAVRTTSRTVFAATVSDAEPGDAWGSPFGSVHGGPGARVVAVEVKGDGFLRHMVRNAVGCLVAVGLGRHDPGWLEQVLASRDRAQAAATAPAAGLFLVGVDY
jgi:tRNA pseudouridine38-40 synthase